jgi:hypothetical protein
VGIRRGLKRTAPQNTTLTGLSSGAHTLTVYAQDTIGLIEASDTFSFVVADSTIPELPNGTDKTEPFPTLPVLAVSVAVVAIIGAGLLIYFKKRESKVGQV